MSLGRKATRDLRWDLFQVDPHCYWCHARVRWMAPANGILADDAATLDHVQSRYVRERGELVPVVLARFKCNRDRNEREQARLPREEILKRSTQPPRSERKMNA